MKLKEIAKQQEKPQKIVKNRILLIFRKWKKEFEQKNYIDPDKA